MGFCLGWGGEMGGGKHVRNKMKQKVKCYYDRYALS